MTKALAIMRPPATMRWGAPVAAFLAVLAVLALANRQPEADPVSALGPEATGEGLAPATARSIALLEGAIRAEPDDASSYSTLGDAYLQGARETADAAYLGRAARAFDAALRRNSEDVAATIGKGNLALAHHDFQGGLELGRESLRLEPNLVRPYAIVADAQIELGRYDAAGATLDRMISLKPTLAAYARVSYFRELNGDLDGAVEAMRLATSAGGGSVEASVYVESLLGNLELARGRYGAAERAFQRALTLSPDYAQARAGLAARAVASGELDAAARGYRLAFAQLPNTENATNLADALEASGHVAAAKPGYARAIEIARADPVEVNQELALLEADHGSSARALREARRAWRLAPSVTSADALAWALHRNDRPEPAWRFARRATALGSRDPALLYRAARIAVVAGQASEARDLLKRGLAANPRFNPLWAPRARRLLAKLL